MKRLREKEAQNKKDGSTTKGDSEEGGENKPKKRKGGV